MLLGYNTNGFGFHRLDDAIDIIAETGYQCIAITPDVHHLHPFETKKTRLREVRKQLDDLDLSVVIESGARYVLDARRKHRPTLLDDDFEPRAWLLQRCMEIADALGARVLSTWSGAVPTEGESASLSREALFEKFAANLAPLLAEAKERGIALAIEPEPGFLVESMADYETLCEAIGAKVPLTLDIGHLRCTESQPEAVFIKKYADRVVNVQLDDMVAGTHQHLPFGEGEVDFSASFKALRAIDYDGPACVELSEGSRNAVIVCRESMEFLRAFSASED